MADSAPLKDDLTRRSFRRRFSIRLHRVTMQAVTPTTAITDVHMRTLRIFRIKRRGHVPTRHFKKQSTRPIRIQDPDITPLILHQIRPGLARERSNRQRLLPLNLREHRLDYELGRWTSGTIQSGALPRCIPLRTLRRNQTCTDTRYKSRPTSKDT